MSSPGKTAKHVKLDERNHVEKPLFDQARVACHSIRRPWIER